MLLLIEPVFGAHYQIRLANLVLIQGIAALATNVTIGYAGLISVALAATMGLGAYTSALLVMKAGVPFPIAFVAACVVSSVFSGLMGFLGTRVKTSYFMLVTLALAGAIALVIVNEAWLTGGPTGLLGIPEASIGSFVADTDQAYYVLVVPIFVVCLYLAQRLRVSKAGTAMVALRINESVARASGVDASRYRIVAMVYAGCYLGAAGSLYAHLVRFLGPESFTLDLSLLLILAVVIGGIGSNVGAVVSVALITVVTQTLQTAGTWWVLLYGLTIMIALLVAPRGLAGVPSMVREGIARLNSRDGGTTDVAP